jgi:hypothetical protein
VPDPDVVKPRHVVGASCGFPRLSRRQRARGRGRLVRGRSTPPWPAWGGLEHGAHHRLRIGSRRDRTRGRKPDRRARRGRRRTRAATLAARHARAAAIALSAPGTLLARALPRRRRARVSRLFHCWATRVIFHPVVASAIATGSLYALSFSPLYQATLESKRLHALMHVSVLALHAILGRLLYSHAGSLATSTSPGARRRRLERTRLVSHRA